MYLWVPGERTESARRVLERDPEWSAPVLWRSEFRSTLGLLLRRGMLTLEQASRCLVGAEATLDGREYGVVSEDVLALVMRSRCSAYDCEFVSLARSLDVPLVTSDALVLNEFPTIAVSPEAFG